jgi:hypothetical protein
VTPARFVSLRPCQLAAQRFSEPLVVGWRLESSGFTSQAVKLASSHGCHFVRDDNTNWFPSASLKIAAVPQGSVFGGIAN